MRSVFLATQLFDPVSVSRVEQVAKNLPQSLNIGGHNRCENTTDITELDRGIGRVINDCGNTAYTVGMNVVLKVW